MAIENTTFHIRAEQKIGIFYVFFSIWRNFSSFFWISEWITETQPRTRIFSYEEKTANIASANCFSSILRNEVCFFLFSSFFSSIWRETTRSTRRFDDFFSDGYLPEFTKRQDPVFLARKTGLLLAKSNTIIGHQSFF